MNASRLRTTGDLMNRSFRLGAAAFALCTMIGLSSAEIEAGLFRKSNDPEDPIARTGRPNEIAPWARPAFGKRDKVYYVGGGAIFSGNWILAGEPRFPHEGTFGLDYAPWYSRVQLRWYHGRRYQDGEGQYEPDHRNNPFSHFWGR